MPACSASTRLHGCPPHAPSRRLRRTVRGPAPRDQAHLRQAARPDQALPSTRRPLPGQELPPPVAPPAKMDHRQANADDRTASNAPVAGQTCAGIAGLQRQSPGYFWWRSSSRPDLSRSLAGLNGVEAVTAAVIVMIGHQRTFNRAARIDAELEIRAMDLVSIAKRTAELEQRVAVQKRVYLGVTCPRPPDSELKIEPFRANNRRESGEINSDFPDLASQSRRMRR